jgi:hypothetical protein
MLGSAHEQQWDRLPGAWDAVEASLSALRSRVEAVRGGALELDPSCFRQITRLASGLEANSNAFRRRWLALLDGSASC